jgi:hypothetical protein
VCAFITLTTQEARERIAKWRFKFNEDGSPNDYYEDFKISQDYKPFKLFGEELEFEVAPEPSDIIWENL